MRQKERKREGGREGERGRKEGRKESQHLCRRESSFQSLVTRQQEKYVSLLLGLDNDDITTPIQMLSVLCLHKIIK